MAIEKSSTVDLIEVTIKGVVQVRSVIKILENDVEIFTGFHRHSISPGDDYSKETQKVQNICAATHTAEVIAAYKAALTAKGV
jgi:hypothetical protein